MRGLSIGSIGGACAALLLSGGAAQAQIAANLDASGGLRAVQPVSVPSNLARPATLPVPAQHNAAVRTSAAALSQLPLGGAGMVGNAPAPLGAGLMNQNQNHNQYQNRGADLMLAQPLLAAGTTGAPAAANRVTLPAALPPLPALPGRYLRSPLEGNQTLVFHALGARRRAGATPVYSALQRYQARALRAPGQLNPRASGVPQLGNLSNRIP